MAAPRGPGCRNDSLLAQAEALDERAVRLDVAALQVVQQAAALADELEQPATRVKILDVRLEMLGKHVDALGEERHLDFGRPGVVLGALVLGDDARLVCGGYGHGKNSPSTASSGICRIEPAILTCG